MCWKQMFPAEDVPAQRVSVPAATCPVPQPIPPKHDGSAAHGAPRVPAQQRWWVLLLSPCRHLWHMDCSHLPTHFRRRQALISIHRLGELRVCPAELRVPRALQLGFPQNSPRNIPCCRARTLGLSLWTGQRVPERKEGEDLHFMPPAQPISPGLHWGTCTLQLQAKSVFPGILPKTH